MEELTVKFTSPSGNSSTHVIYCKKHSLRQQSNKTPNDRTLFTVGWPPYCSEDEIKEIFSRTGQVESVFLREKPGNVEETGEIDAVKRFKRRDFGYIVFRTVEGLTHAISLCRSKVTISYPINSVGIHVWKKQYKLERPPVAILESRAEKEVGKYDSWIANEKKRKKLVGEPDEEGWVTVTKKNPVEVEQSTVKKKRKKQQHHLKLYPFQMRESQREKLAELRKKFEEDKKRVVAMKARRKFKPF